MTNSSGARSRKVADFSDKIMLKTKEKSALIA
jgi:hypothetical protein